MKSNIPLRIVKNEQEAKKSLSYHFAAISNTKPADYRQIAVIDAADGHGIEREKENRRDRNRQNFFP